MSKTTSKVCGELMNEALDQISGTDGIRACELGRLLRIASSTASTVVKQLVELRCISKCAVKYFRKDGETVLKTGYIYEHDLPKDLKITKRKLRKQHKISCQ